MAKLQSIWMFAFCITRILHCYEGSTIPGEQEEPDDKNQGEPERGLDLDDYLQEPDDQNKGEPERGIAPDENFQEPEDRNQGEPETYARYLDFKGTKNTKLYINVRKLALNIISQGTARL